MSIDKAKLKALAKTASRYDWSRQSLDLSHKFPPDYELYIVECSPYTILALLAELDQLKAENEELRKDAERYRSQFRSGEWDYNDEWISESKEAVDSMIDASIAEEKDQ